jgi:hypothetical protein
VSTTLALDDVKALSAPSGTRAPSMGTTDTWPAPRIGTTDPLPAPRTTLSEMQQRLASLKQEVSITGDAERVEYLQAEIDVIERELKKRGVWVEPGEGD